MKVVVVCLLCILALNTHANDSSPVQGLIVSDGEISWTDSQGWMQVQDMESYRVVEQCEGLITSCTVPNGRAYQVIDHSNGRISTDIRPLAGSSPQLYESLLDCTLNYNLPEDGAWYQLQETDTYSTVCQSSGNTEIAPPCSLDPGTYQLVEFRDGSITANDEYLRCEAPDPASTIALEAEQDLLSVQDSATDTELATELESASEPAPPSSQVQQTQSLDTTGFTVLPIVTGAGYGSFNDNMWQTMMRDSRKVWGGTNANIKTAIVNGRKAHIHKIHPTPRGNNAGTDRVEAVFDISRRTEATLVQWIRMEPDYAMGRKYQTGKWGFGLIGGSGPTGGSNAHDGFSLRLAPFGDGTQPDTQSEVTMNLYVYSSDKVQPNYGDRLPLIDPSTNSAFVMPRDGSWVQFAMYAKMNSSARASDGILRGYVNGVLMLEQTGKRWFASSRSGTPHIDKILVNTFMGGNSGDWAPTKVNEIMFADISLGFSDR